MPRRLLLALAVLLPAVLLPVSTAHGGDLLANGGFEAGGEPWQVLGDGNLLLENARVHSGARAGKLESTSNAIVRVYQRVAVAPGEPYLLNGYVLKSDPNVGFIRLEVQWRAPDLSLLGPPELIAALTFAGEEYVLLGPGQPPALSDAYWADVSVATIRKTEAPLGSSFTIWFDDLSFQGPPAPPPTPTLSGPTAMPEPVPAPVSAVASTEAGPTVPPAPLAPAPGVFPLLANGGFELGQADGSPLAWRKFGGEMSRSTRFRFEGDYAAAFTSRTDSTKWAYETVLVQPGRYYEFAAMALKDSPGAQEVYLSVLWLASADGGGQNIGGDDSTARLTVDSSSFRLLTTGPVRAPEAALSAKLRLMLRPRSVAPATVYFDAVTFGETASLSNPSAGGVPVRPAWRQPAVEGAQRTPISLANLSSSGEEPPPSQGEGGGYGSILALGLGVVLGLAGLILAWKAQRWWRSRLGRA